MAKSGTFETIRRAILEDQIVFFLGAGASLSPAFDYENQSWAPDSGVAPSAANLSAELLRGSNIDTSEIACLELPRIASLYEACRSRGELRNEMERLFGRCKKPLPLHEYLSKLDSHPIIVTTNFDDLIERQFDKVGKEYDLLLYAADGAGESNKRLHLSLASGGGKIETGFASNELARCLKLGEKPLIYKIHGSIGNTRNRLRPGHFVITERDYEEIIAKGSYLLPPALLERFDYRHFLFLGYSVRDWNIRVLLRKLLNETRHQTSWAILAKSDEVAMRTWGRRSLEVVTATIQEFLTGVGYGC